MPQPENPKSGGFFVETTGERPPIYFFTLATKNTRGFPQYLSSCSRLGIEPTILGRGQEWTGFTMKFRLLAEVLAVLDPHAIVVMTDSYDLVFQRGPDCLYECYTRYGKPIVFSSETGSGWPNPATILPETPDPRYRSLCAGFWMTTVQFARKMLDDIYPDGFRDDIDDQWALQQWFSKHPDDGTVDWRNTLVSSPASGNADKEFDYSGTLVRHKPTDTYPCALHVLGADMTGVFLALELPDWAHTIPGSRSQQLILTNNFAFLNSWPETIPDAPEDSEAMFESGNARMLAQIFKENKIRVVLELGSWVGMGSTRFFLKNKDFNGMVICNDTWKDDSPELTINEFHLKKIPLLFETFCRNNWPYRNRIIPLRQDTLDGIKAVADFGIHPGLIYVDANHGYDNVMKQLELIRELFPHTIVTGDDWRSWDSVKQAVIDFVRKYGIGLQAEENFWVLKER
jgi:hypothetical protein